MRLAALALLLAPASAMAQHAPRVLDDFRDPQAWTALASDQVGGTLRSVDAPGGQGLCLDYDFQGVSGYADMKRELPLDFPADYEFDFRWRGSGPRNDVQFKLIDASGENVWWVNRPALALPADWSAVRYKARQIVPAWGPAQDKTLRRTRFLEVTTYAHDGGQGTLCIADLRWRERPPVPAVWPAPRLSTRGQAVALPSEAAPWRSARGGEQMLQLDFGAAREFGGLVLRWLPGLHATQYDVELSDDAKTWRRVRRVVAGNGGEDDLLLSESEVRYLRLVLHAGPGAAYALRDIDVQPLAFGASPNAFLQALAAQAPRGAFPRSLSGEQSYWTVVGVDGGEESGLLGEDGALEIARGGVSIEPFVIDEAAPHCAPGAAEYGRRPGGNGVSGWADVTIAQRLQDDYLPLPSVQWKHPAAPRNDAACPGTPSIPRAARPHGASAAWSLDIDAFAAGARGASRLVAQYTLHNDDDAPHAYTLALAIQPWQVNPPTQFLTTPGGVSPIHALGYDGRAVAVNGVAHIRPLAAPSAFFATPFDADLAAAHLGEAPRPSAQRVDDETGLASGALLYRLELPPHAARRVALDIPLDGAPAAPEGDAEAWVAAQRAATVAAWKDRLDRVVLQGPPAVQTLANALRTALAHILIERDGAQLRPGTRSYARAWIRDGAMMAEGLLRLGHADAAQAFLDWFAPFQFADGKVPCCADRRGADPVPENDSHGEFVFLAGELLRYTQDTKAAESTWSNVEKAIDYMDRLRRSERGDAARGSAHYGLLPRSISHEGYSDRPAYSYWDDFWGLIGYRSGAALAQSLGHAEAARRIAQSGDAFAADLRASILAGAHEHAIGYIPGAADRGDFDATSTTIALSPGVDRAVLPPDLLTGTFARYWEEFVARRDGARAWKDYTPYEWRNVAALLRLGQPARARAAMDFFLRDRRPAAWNGWAEVVGREPREPRFLGDLPHGWVASDFIRSALDLFAYERRDTQALVLAAGVAPEWLDGGGVALAGLRTPYGLLSYRVWREQDRIVFDVADTGRPLPPGGIVLRWPGRGEPQAARLGRRRLAWLAGELHLDRLPAKIVTREGTEEGTP